MAQNQRKPSPLGRSIWTGPITLGAITAHVKLFTSRRSDRDQSLKTICADCQQPVKTYQHCPKHGEITRDDTSRAYEITKDELVPIDVNQLPKDRKSEAIDIQTTIDFLRVEAHMLTGKAYWIIPESEGHRKAFSLIYHALDNTSTAAVFEGTINRHTGPFAIMAYEEVLACFPLAFAEDFKSIPVFGLESRTVDCTREEISLAKRIAKGMIAKDWRWEEYQDHKAQELGKLVKRAVKRGDSYTVADVVEDKSFDMKDAMKSFLEQKKTIG